MITSDQWVLNCVKGYEIDWVAQPSQTQMPRELVFSKTEADCLSQLTGSGEPCAEGGDEISMPTNEMLTLYRPYTLESVVHDGFAFSASCAFVSSAPAD